MRPKNEMLFLSTALFLLVALLQSSQCTDVNNDSSVIEAVGGAGDSQAKAEGLASTEDKLSALTADGMATRARYFKSFGGNPTGDPNLNIYSFGLGKRTSRSYSINPYSFGLGKRAGNAKSYPQQIPYSFGLGKRNPTKYNFGLGKRPDRFGFGLGKRNLKDDDLDQWQNDEEYSQFDDTEEDIEGREDDSQEIMDVNKRSQMAPGQQQQQQQQAFFPSHLQSAFYGGPFMSNLARANTHGFGKSRTFNQQAATHDLPNLGKRLPVYNFGLGK
ncbi:allatostatins-like [Daphnia pulicaria]|uniref:allatostatins-like n=1 Tax=Daphnia pulicaria TaxID=35523 RepID=UPI001EEB2E56|nr:allatostatins-like [Daphnia pulicaria]